ncbi:mycofactocin system FadH/OYE family oxidoreductase 1 [Actinomycetospora sp. TBRC 11914]|uniref:mycofactocin system FadH/OYE family oxidoreductase 1 n=1 Tax=Actinomycetospora sp. TBRC 11914 TaxID=2729387 RepID=UPI00145E06DE|nr:mycofactocin system FadH/OYE family oxidoreductase 1 [Actinomycetospora sp. TBRC 11914]NMO88968.1 mycofactocin system FadH/OYE family oxidoreductase 1 [Actinomycetospora sp. TBRC 11914]
MGTGGGSGAGGVRSLTGPVVLGARTAPSRVLFGPHVTNLAEPGRPRELAAAHVGHYARRAAGGAGIVVTEVASVHDSDRPYDRSPRAADCGPGWSAIAAACRPHGTLVLAGLGHAGSQGSSAHHRRPLWAPSPVPDPVSREVPAAMDEAAVAAVVDGFAAAAALARAAGADGVEIGAGQHALLRQFLSGLTNHRSDRWGADRGLLLRDTVAAVRAAVGDDAVVGLRLAVDELAPWAGLTPDDVAVPAGLDYVVGVRGSGLTVAATRPDAHTPPGYGRPLAAALRRVAPPGTAVVLAGGVVDVPDAAAALDQADLVEMTRALLADPDLVAHARAGRAPRPCVLTNQRCRVRDVRNPRISCTVAPTSGVPTVPPDDGRAVRVVGGGPTGLEGALTLARAGYRVTLLERDDDLGGLLRAVARLPGRGRFARLVEWWRAELVRHDVTVRLGVTADPDPDVPTLWATGGVDRDPPVPGVVALPAAAVLAGAAVPDGPVVVWDPIGDATGVGVAELLAAGRDVALVTGDPVVGHELGGDLVPAQARLLAAGVRRVVRHDLTGAADGALTLRQVDTGEVTTLPAAALVDTSPRAPGPVPDGARADGGLLVVGPRVLAGDVVAPRTVHEAVLDGRRAAARVASTSSWARA